MKPRTLFVAAGLFSAAGIVNASSDRHSTPLAAQATPGAGPTLPAQTLIPALRPEHRAVFCGHPDFEPSADYAERVRTELRARTADPRVTISQAVLDMRKRYCGDKPWSEQ